MSTQEYSEATDGELPVRAIQRRLTSLEAGAATGVIVASLVALAMMTGVVPKPQPAISPTPVVMQPSLPKEEIIPDSQLPPLPVAPMLIIANAIEPTPTALPVKPDGQSLDESVSAPRATLRKSRKASSKKSRHALVARSGHRKTREQVMAELARAKRDGSYQAALDTYR